MFLAVLVKAVVGGERAVEIAKIGPQSTFERKAAHDRSQPFLDIHSANASGALAYRSGGELTFAAFASQSSCISGSCLSDNMLPTFKVCCRKAVLLRVNFEADTWISRSCVSVRCCEDCHQRNFQQNNAWAKLQHMARASCLQGGAQPNIQRNKSLLPKV